MQGMARLLPAWHDRCADGKAWQGVARDGKRWQDGNDRRDIATAKASPQGTAPSTDSPWPPSTLDPCSTLLLLRPPPSTVRRHQPACRQSREMKKAPAQPATRPTNERTSPKIASDEYNRQTSHSSSTPTNIGPCHCHWSSRQDDGSDAAHRRPPMDPIVYSRYLVE